MNEIDQRGHRIIRRPQIFRGLGCHSVNMRKIIYVLIYEVATLLLFATQVSKLIRACLVIVF